MPRKIHEPWYKKTIEIVTLFVGVCAIQVVFANRVDKDEYQRITSTTVLIALNELRKHLTGGD